MFDPQTRRERIIPLIVRLFVFVCISFILPHCHPYPSSTELKPTSPSQRLFNTKSTLDFLNRYVYQSVSLNIRVPLVEPCGLFVLFPVIPSYISYSSHCLLIQPHHSKCLLLWLSTPTFLSIVNWLLCLLYNLRNVIETSLFNSFFYFLIK